MYDKLNYNLEIYAYDDMISDNMWEDTTRDDTIEILHSFTEEDWQKLFQELPTKSTMWQKRLVDCIISEDNQNELKVLLFLANTNDPVLFAEVIVAIYDFDLSNIEGLDSLYDKVEKMVPLVPLYRKSVLTKFKKKKNSVRSK